MTRLRATGPALTLPSRVERKYVLPQPRTRSAGAWLRHACRPAPQYATGSVSSCYFDTPNLDAYYESADGSLDKAKVRLRWYDDPLSPAADAAGRDAGAEMTAFLELKGRRGAESWKRRMPITLPRAGAHGGARGGALPVLPRPAQLTDLLARLGYAAPAALRPVVLVRYQRSRFVEPVTGTRVSLDHDVSVAAPWDRGAPPLRLPEAVVELKGDGEALPRRLSALGRFAQPWSSNSKYAAAVEALDLVPVS